MSYSRRNFLKAAGCGVALTAVAGDQLIAAPTRLPQSFSSEKSTFMVNGKLYSAEYEARTTLWEVIAMKFGLTGTNRSCNRGSCGACSVLVDGIPLYSCHTLATEGVGKKIVTIEGLSSEGANQANGDPLAHLHPLQRIGHMRVAADCGFCTAGWVVTAKGLLDKNLNPSEEQVKEALAGHICRCSAYPHIIRTVMDTAAVLRGSKEPIKPELENVVHIKMPMVRDYSTNGGHGPGDEVIEGPSRTVTKKWQGYPPENLNVLGTPLPPLPEVSIPRFTGKAQYASRVWFPNLLYARFLTCAHPHANVKEIDASAAEKMPGVHHILTYKNAPQLLRPNVARGRILPEPLPRELNLQGEPVAIVVADTEDLAQDAADAIKVEYEVLPYAAMLKDTMAPGAPDLGHGKGNLIRHSFSPQDRPDVTWMAKQGDIDQGFAGADFVKEFAYRFVGGVSVPMQPSGSVAKWDGDKLTVWAMGQGIYPVRASLAAALGIDVSKVRIINKWNGSTFGAARMAAERFYPMIAHLAKITGRPVKIMLPKDQELAQLQIKPETITKFRVGYKKDGQIVALDHEVFVSCADLDFGVHADGPGNAANQTELYTAKVPHWRSTWSAFRTNAPRPGPSRSHIQQETKWSWENMIDEMADITGIDPIQYRTLHMTQLTPGDKSHYYETMPTVEVLREGAKAFGWDKRNPVAGSNPGRFKRGFGLGMSQHHGGNMGYHEGEVAYAKLAAAPDANIFTSDLDLTAEGNVTMRIALPDSGSNAATALAAFVAEMLGFTTRDRIKLIWGDSDLSPLSDEWFGGRTITLQGAALGAAADKMRKDLLVRASNVLKVDAAKLKIRDGVISSIDHPGIATTFAALAQANNGLIRHTGKGTTGGERTALNKGVGAVFIEVEVDTWTGNWKFVRAVYTHDTGLVINPLVSEADMVGSLMESTQVATESIPWDREFPGSRHYSVGYLSYRLPTIMDIPKSTQVYIDSLEPRWFYGIKSFSETTIGAVPGAISNAIFNACGVRIREQPITREKIMAGLTTKKNGRLA